MLEKWAYFLKHAEETPEYEVEPFVGNDVILERAYQELNKTYWNEAEMNSYESELLYIIFTRKEQTLAFRPGNYKSSWEFELLYSRLIRKEQTFAFRLRNSMNS